MERRGLAPPTDSAPPLTTVPQSPRGPERCTRRRVCAARRRISCALNRGMWEFDAPLPASPDGTSMPTRRLVKPSNIMDVKETEITLLLRSLARITVSRKPAHREPSLRRMEMAPDLSNAPIREEMEEFPEDVLMDTPAIHLHCWIRMCVVELPLSCNLSAQPPRLHSSLLSPFNQCNVLQMSTEPVQETSSAGSPPPPPPSTPSTAVDHQTVLILDTAHRNWCQYPVRTEPNTSTARHPPHSTTPSKDAVPIDIVNSRPTWRDTSVVDWSPMSDCRMSVHHNQPIWCLWSWLEIIGRAIHTPVLEPHNHVQTTRLVSTLETTTVSSVAEFNWDKERAKFSHFCFFVNFFSLSLQFVARHLIPHVHVYSTKKINISKIKKLTLYGFCLLLLNNPHHPFPTFFFFTEKKMSENVIFL